MKILDVINYIEEKFPLEYQEDFDNCGLILGNETDDLKGILICLQITENIIDEAIDKNCNLVISHHPLIINGIKSILFKNETGRIIQKSIKNNISIYAAHTNVDKHIEGLSGFLAKKFGLTNIEVLEKQKNFLFKVVVFCPIDYADKVRNAMFESGAGVIGNYDCCSYNLEGFGTFRGNENTNAFVGEKFKVHREPEIRIETIVPGNLIKNVITNMIKVHPYEEVAYDIYPLANEYPKCGLGVIGSLEKPIETKQFIDMVKEVIKTPCLLTNTCNKKDIQKVAICTGSGASLIKSAISKKVDCFITADVKFHDFYATSDLLIISAGHYETEIFFKELMYEYISQKFSNFAILQSTEEKNFIKYI